MRRLIIIFFTVILLCNCKDNQMTSGTARVKYIYEDIEFFDNGIARNIVSSVEYKYQENETHLQLENDTEIMLFDFMGRINDGWKLINYHEVKSKYQITNFEISGSKPIGADIQEFLQTIFVVIPPTVPNFDDEDSEEADEYYTMTDDWAWYISETQTQIESMGVPIIWADKRYLSFVLSETETITVDVSQSQNGTSISGLLYKQGEIPIMIYTMWIDNDAMSIYDFLGVEPKAQETTNP